MCYNLRMFLITALGNKGEEYAQTRHNTGWIVLDLLEEKKGLRFFKPDTYMNTSGGPIASYAKKNNIAPEHVVVIYDDMDLPLGKIKISFDRGSGGHNGVKSVIESLGTTEFVRIRVGVSPQTPDGELKKPLGEEAVLDFLMKNFKPSEIKELEKVAVRVGEALDVLIADGREKAMTLFNA